MRRLIAVLLTGCFAAPSMAEVVVVYAVQITKLYAQSRLDSDAHLIQVSQTINSACHWNRLYIDVNDRELFSTALAKHLAGNSVDVIFDTNATPRTAVGHATIPCRVISIF